MRISEKIQINQCKEIIENGGNCYDIFWLKCNMCVINKLNIHFNGCGCAGIHKKRLNIAKAKLKELEYEKDQKEVDELIDKVLEKRNKRLEGENMNIRKLKPQEIIEVLKEKIVELENLVEERKVPFRVGGVYELKRRREIFLLHKATQTYSLVSFCGEGWWVYGKQKEELYKILQEDGLEYICQSSDILKEALDK